MDSYDQQLSGDVGQVGGTASPERWDLPPQGGRFLVCSSSRQHQRGQARP